MAITPRASGKFLQTVLTGGSFNYTSDTIKVALLSSAGLTAWNQDTHIYVQDLINAQANWEVTGTNYTAGGQALGTKTVNYDTTSNYIQFRAATTTWSSSSITAFGAIVYKSTGDYATSLIVGIVDFGGSITSNNGDFSIYWDATQGVFRVQALPTA